MSRIPSASTCRRITAPADLSLHFDAMGEAASLAARYAATAAEGAAIQDLRLTAYGLRSAAPALQEAARLAEELRPVSQGKREAA